AARKLVPEIISVRRIAGEEVVGIHRVLSRRKGAGRAYASAGLGQAHIVAPPSVLLGEIELVYIGHGADQRPLETHVGEEGRQAPELFALPLAKVEVNSFQVAASIMAAYAQVRHAEERP